VKPGDVVQLVSGGPPMTVGYVYTSGVADIFYVAADGSVISLTVPQPVLIGADFICETCSNNLPSSNLWPWCPYCGGQIRKPRRIDDVTTER